MLVDTKTEGLIEVNDRQKIFFPNGIIGFETYKNYALLDSQSPPFFWLQSMDAKNLAFVLLSPFLVVEDYELNVDRSFYKDIELEEDETKNNLIIFSIVTIPEEKENITANLQAPILINKENRYAVQAIQNNSKWEIRHVISKKKE